ncbi:MAG: YggS family pyridoxal phosphate-dependent enzyme [Haliscomenobacter sp.]|uniref:YggS family pyridoxal phosphate-dependent enzyme n=1 Tax=Haliscomenobacter sp. TaxID=2717303 RepID=UPI0029A9FBC3|nr:YggS family pyridoxal phosphate-dependent enzyme [Haliscomenobacter sp.]MDX2068963.1 YggS family pyridoxal phosphate-dependent enzyme [Haliscomenobacter sp.]
MYKQLIQELGSARLVAVSKTQPNEAIMDLYAQGQRLFGENKVQEVVPKFEALPKDIEWHLIGHLQSNKVKYIASFVAMIHSVDSLKLLEEINRQAVKNRRVIDCLLQFKINDEETKFGLDIQEAFALLESLSYPNLQNIRLCGVMGMASFVEDEEQIRREFKSLKNIFDQLKARYFPNDPAFKEISMGMSDDYPIAVEEGSTLVRIGTLLFGARNYGNVG